MSRLSKKSMLARAVLLVTLVVVESLWLEDGERVRSTLEGAQLMVARSAGLVLSLAGFENTVDGINIQLANGTVAVTEECIGLDVSLFLASAMFVQPAPLRRKLLGAVASLLAVTGLNWIRVITLALLLWEDRTVFDVTHLYVWPAVIILACVAILLLWMRTIPGDAEANPT